MAIDSTHPSYAAMVDTWRLMRVSYAGEGAVKAQGETYLPPTPSMRLDGYGKPPVGKDAQKGQAAYDNYKLRARFPDYVTEAVQYYVGMLNQKPAVIELPDGMKDMLDKATNEGESLHALLRCIHAEQLISGRMGLLLDLPPSVAPGETVMPYIACYSAEAVINWDPSADGVGVNSLDLVVLDESGPIRQPDFTWKDIKQYRVLELRDRNEVVVEDNLRNAEQAADAKAKRKTPPAPVFRENPDARVTANPQDGKRLYKQTVVRDHLTGAVSSADMTPPVIRGKALNQIPFVFINPSDVTATPDAPPLLGLARICMGIYRGEADYRHSLFMQGQETLVTVGGIIDPDEGAGDSPASSQDGVRVGAGARIDLNLGGDAKYIGVSGEGLSEQRTALENDRKEAEARSGKLIAPNAGKQESGDALTTRMSAQTASLNQIAKTSALGLQNILKIAAEWLGFDAKDVVVTPNLEFVDQAFVAKDLLDTMSARTMGAPISLESIHEWIAAHGMTKKTFEEEMAKIEEEDLTSAKAAAKVAAANPPLDLIMPKPAPANAPAPAPAKK